MRACVHGYHSRAHCGSTGKADGCNGCLFAPTAAQAEAQLAQKQQQQTDAQQSAPTALGLDMAFDWLGVDMAAPVTAASMAATTSTAMGHAATTSASADSTLPTPVSPLVGGNHAFARDFMPGGMLGEPLTDLEMADAFLLDAHGSDWYATCLSPQQPDTSQNWANGLLTD